jgi:hypothetical protein
MSVSSRSPRTPGGAGRNDRLSGEGLPLPALEPVLVVSRCGLGTREQSIASLIPLGAHLDYFPIARPLAHIRALFP